MELKQIKKLSHAKGIAFSEKYLVVLTGQKVHVLNKSDFSELACFSDLKYAYKAVISSDEKMLVVKGTVPRLAFYSLETLSLIKKFSLRVHDQTQDQGICFSNDNKYLYNILYDENLLTVLQKYDMETFELAETLFNDHSYVLEDIKYILSKGAYFLYGFERVFKKDNKNFIMWFDGEKVLRRMDIEQHAFHIFYSEYSNIFIADDYQSSCILDENGKVIDEKNLCSDEKRPFNWEGLLTGSIVEDMDKDKIDSLKIFLKTLGKRTGKHFVDYIHKIIVTTNGKYFIAAKSTGLEIFSMNDFKSLHSIEVRYGVNDVVELQENIIAAIFFTGHTEIYEIIE